MKLFKKKERENLVITVDILTKRKYDLQWQREHIGDLLIPFVLNYFKESAILYFNEKDLFTGFEISLFKSNFKLNKIEDNTIPEQFMYRYIKFLPSFLEFMDSVLKDSRLKFKFSEVKHLISTQEETLLSHAKNMDGGTINFRGDGTEKEYSIRVDGKKERDFKKHKF